MGGDARPQRIGAAAQLASGEPAISTGQQLRQRVREGEQDGAARHRVAAERCEAPTRGTAAPRPAAPADPAPQRQRQHQPLVAVRRAGRRQTWSRSPCRSGSSARLTAETATQPPTSAPPAAGHAAGAAPAPRARSRAQPTPPSPSSRRSDRRDRRRGHHDPWDDAVPDVRREVVLSAIRLSAISAPREAATTGRCAVRRFMPAAAPARTATEIVPAAGLCGDRRSPRRSRPRARPRRQLRHVPHVERGRRVHPQPAAAPARRSPGRASPRRPWRS